ncbi:MAG: hypothetical protein H0V44_10345 [Planctomycetes bacterium]|nr:hypothetical protein [Planctomycetota bacterium]
MRYHLSSDGPVRIAHQVETFSRWGMYVLLAGFGMLLIDARIGIALIPVGVVIMIAGGRAARRSGSDAATVANLKHAQAWPVP